MADPGLEALVLCLGGCARGEEALLATLVEGFDKLVEEGTGPVTWCVLGCSIREDTTSDMLSPGGPFLNTTSCVIRLSKHGSGDVGQIALLVGGRRDVFVMAMCTEVL